MKKKNIVISEILPKLLHERKITAKKLSMETGVPTSTLSTWTLPKTKPRNIDDVAAVADFFGVSLNYLLFGENDKKKQIEGKPGEVILSGIYRLKLELIEPLSEK